MSLTKERIREMSECNKGLEAMTMQYPSPNEIEELASALLTYQERILKLEKLLTEQHEIIDEMNARGKTFDQTILLRLTEVWNKQRELL